MKLFSKVDEEEEEEEKESGEWKLSSFTESSDDLNIDENERWLRKSAQFGLKKYIFINVYIYIYIVAKECNDMAGQLNGDRINGSV